MVTVLSLIFQQCFALFNMFPSNGPLKRDFSDIYIIRFFRVRNCGNISAMTVIFVVENVHNLMYISKMHRKIEKKAFLFEIILPELVAFNCLF